jgi:hypothetical protein
MQNASAACRVACRFLQVLAGLLVLLLLLVSPALGQQDYVGRFDAFGGFTYLDSPHVKLGEKGFHLQTGVRVVSWLSLGLDYSRATGDLTLTPDLLPTALATQLAGEIATCQAVVCSPAGKLSASYVLSVPASSTSQTFAAGPQAAWRHWQHLTLFVRPSAGAIHEVAVPNPAAGDWFAAGVVNTLVPSGTKTNTVLFYGFGGGADVLFTKHWGLRLQADLVRDHLFKDILKDARTTVRISIGPAIQWGGNVAK